MIVESFQLFLMHVISCLRTVTKIVFFKMTSVSNLVSITYPGMYEIDDAENTTSDTFHGTKLVASFTGAPVLLNAYSKIRYRDIYKALRNDIGLHLFLPVSLEN